MVTKLMIFLILSISSFAINCSSFGGEFKEFDGHYYVLTNKMSFEKAKQFAIANDGYIAIPNNKAENDFLKSFINSNAESWIGIYDPNYSQNFCLTNNCFSTNRLRFKTVKNGNLVYQNWDYNDVENKIIDGDQTIGIDGVRLIVTLGEPYVLISGNSGLWRDWGTHFISGDNPYKERAIIEFESKPECFLEDDVEAELEETGIYCNTKVWDNKIDEISSATTLECQSDIYGNNYCPDSLAPADIYWDYEDGYSVKHQDSVTDFEKGTYSEHTGTVRDFVNGTSTSHESTETNYNNGTSTTYTGSVVDYVSKTSSSSSYPATLVKYAQWYETYNNGSYIYLYSQDWAGIEAITNCPELPKKSAFGESVLGTEYTKNKAIGTKIGTAQKKVVNTYFDCDTLLTCKEKRTEYSCPNGGTLSGTTCYTTATTCPTDYTDNGSNCKRTISYKYYSYGCPSGYSPQNVGISSWSKTDPDKTKNNSATLDDAVNSSTPPANNCKQVLNSTAYEYLCSNGYTPIDKGKTSCSAGTDGACNNATPPNANCYKDILYKYYSYGCSENYSTVNYGLNSCTKTDPDTTRNNEATLNDDCNAKEPPIGNCSKDITYSYYQYLCNSELNAQREDYVTQDIGISSWTKTDSDKTNNNSATLDDAVNSSTPPANNCKRKGFTCNSTMIPPALINNQWQCSPFPCLGDSDYTNLDASVGSSDKKNDGWAEDGGCAGQMYIFNGKANKCRAWDRLLNLGGGGCCDKDKVFLGLIECKAEEKLLAKKNKEGQCHYIGQFCSKELKLLVGKVCVVKSDSHCCFNSKLARIIQEQGRPQLGIGWGSADNPDCRGFTPEEFQKLDLSKVDFSEAFSDININQENISTITNNLESKIQNIQR